MTRKTKRMLVTKFTGLKAKAQVDLNRCPSAAIYDSGYARGYDVAMKNVIETVKEMKTESE